MIKGMGLVRYRTLRPNEPDAFFHSGNLAISTLIRDEMDPSPCPPNIRFAETLLETKDGFMAIV